MQVSRYSNRHLAQVLVAKMQAPENRLAYRWKTAHLLHLCDASSVNAAVENDISALLSLKWRGMAFHQPALALKLSEAALSSAVGKLDQEKRWELVRPFRHSERHNIISQETRATLKGSLQAMAHTP